MPSLCVIMQYNCGKWCSIWLNILIEEQESHWKDIALLILLKSIYIKHLGFNKKVFLNTTERLKQEKNFKLLLLS